MLVRPFLLLYRGRLIPTVILWLGAALVVLFSHSGAQIFGWYFFPCFWTGAFLGGWWQNNTEVYFLFTRPIPRSAAVLRPLAIASFAIAVFALLPLGWRVFAAPLAGAVISRESQSAFAATPSRCHGAGSG